MKVIELKNRSLSDLKTDQEKACLIKLKELASGVVSAEKNLEMKRKTFSEFQDQNIDSVKIKHHSQ